MRLFQHFKRFLKVFYVGKIIYLALIIIFFAPLTNCTLKENVDPVTGKPEVFEPNSHERARKYASENPLFFGTDRKKANNDFEFSTSNILWRATLKNLDFLPLSNADYSGGIIVYDWYSQDNNAADQIKISVQFLSNEIRSSSIKIIVNKKRCDEFGKCKNLPADQNFSDKIKDSIIETARTLRIEELNKRK
jgi:hypothetical protein